MKVIYIASLGHSGSTLLDMVLSKHSQVMGFGQIESTVKQGIKGEDGDRLCSCGSKRTECSIWKDILNTDRYTEVYNNLIEYANSNGMKAIVDSTKNTSFLGKLKDNNDIDIDEIYVIYILKDVRSWTYSVIKRDLDRYGKTKSNFTYFLRWWWHNMKMKREVKNSGLKYIQVGYENFCLNTEEILENVFSDMDLDIGLYNENNIPNTHIASGNVMRKKEKEVKIKYDDEWKNHIKSYLFILLPFIYIWNRWNT